MYVTYKVQVDLLKVLLKGNCGTTVLGSMSIEQAYCRTIFCRMFLQLSHNKAHVAFVLHPGIHCQAAGSPKLSGRALGCPSPA